MVVHCCTQLPATNPMTDSILLNRCRSRQGTEVCLSNSIAHRAATRIVAAREALGSVFEFGRRWIRANDRTTKLRRDCSRSPQNNINRECSGGTICFEHGRESPANPRVEEPSAASCWQSHRSETDHGVVLLIDALFNEVRYRRLFPAWWKYARVGHTSALGNAIGDFWNAGSKSAASCETRRNLVQSLLTNAKFFKRPDRARPNGCRLKAKMGKM